jgi:hypothetical protein
MTEMTLKGKKSRVAGNLQRGFGVNWSELEFIAKNIAKFSQGQEINQLPLHHSGSFVRFVIDTHP